MIIIEFNNADGNPVFNKYYGELTWKILQLKKDVYGLNKKLCLNQFYTEDSGHKHRMGNICGYLYIEVTKERLNKFIFSQMKCIPEYFILLQHNQKNKRYFLAQSSNQNGGENLSLQLRIKNNLYMSP